MQAILKSLREKEDSLLFRQQWNERLGLGPDPVQYMHRNEARFFRK